MADTDKDEQEKEWYVKYMGHLRYLAGIKNESRKPDLGALAELRNSARGGTFKIRALRHVIPYIKEDDNKRRYEHHVQVSLILGQLFAAYRPEGPRPETDSEDKRQYRSLGRLLGEAEARKKKSGDSSTGTDDAGQGRHSPTALERHLQTVTAADLDRLGPRLRGTLARLKQAGIALEMDDYWSLIRDLDKWTRQSKVVQYNWIKDFYSRSHRPE